MSTLSQSKTIQQKDPKKWYSFSQDDIWEKLELTGMGLTTDEVKKRYRKYGKNKLPEAQKKSSLSLLLSQLKSSLVYVLLAAAIISAALGDFVDAGIIMFAVIINVIIGFYQEFKAEQTLSALKKIIVSHAKVLRDGHKQQIDTTDLVVGDIVYLNAGDKIPADIRLLKVNDFKINEATLTGESTEVIKTNKVLSGDLILADRTNMAFMGTQATQGNGTGVVVEIGSKTVIGKITNLVVSTDNLITPLQRKLNIFAKKISILILAVSSLIFIAGLIAKYSFTQIFITAVAVAVSAIPEGLLVVVTMILAVGMQRILKKKTLVKHLLAAEILGSVSVICVDKTGTLTEGEMRVVEIATLDYNLNFLKHKKIKEKMEAAELLTILNIGMLCNNAYIENPDKDLQHRIVRGTPTEKALLLAGTNIGLDKTALEKKEKRIDEFPFDGKWKFMMTLNKEKNGSQVVYIKGAPEVLLNFSKYIYSAKHYGNKQELTDSQKEKMIETYKNMSRRGLRVLAAGYKKVKKDIKKIDNIEKNDFIFVGLIGIKDPIRPEIKETIKQVKKAGIQTIMITGDHELTAKTIADELGLPTEDKNIISGSELLKLNESQLLEIVNDIKIYARVTPEDKLKIVKAWQDKGAVVAMTGDGINDAPALKKANIGIAVGSGTDVAKDTADAILLDNNFGTIVAAIKEGRAIYDNIKKIILFFLSDSFTEMIVITVGLFIGWPLPLLAAQIIWVNLIDDTLPALAMTQEPIDAEIMKQKPRSINESLLNKESKILIGLISILSAIGTLFFFDYFWRNFGDLMLARTMAFTFLGMSTLIYAFSIRNLNKPIWQTNLLSNKFLVGSAIIGFILQSLAIYNPLLQRVFGSVPLGLSEWSLILFACLLLVGIIEIIKTIYYKKK